jgi:hypothetical protein
MNTVMRFRWVRPAAAIPLLGVLFGCGSGHARYTPSAGEARSSLEAAMNAWRDGKRISDVQATPPVHVVDSVWQGGQQIDSFQIGNEEDVGDGTKQFVVELTMKKAKGTQDVRYVVHGRDPVWVFREEDYKRTLNMDNNPVPGSKPRSVPQRSGRSR